MGAGKQFNTRSRIWPDGPRTSQTQWSGLKAEKQILDRSTCFQCGPGPLWSVSGNTRHMDKSSLTRPLLSPLSFLFCSFVTVFYFDFHLGQGEILKPSLPRSVWRVNYMIHQQCWCGRTYTSWLILKQEGKGTALCFLLCQTYQVLSVFLSPNNKLRNWLMTQPSKGLARVCLNPKLMPCHTQAILQMHGNGYFLKVTHQVMGLYCK